jgi:glycosyltransferase involved in cell wall biosynthesis
MLSVVIATHDSERTLPATLAALIPGSATGLVREVIVADGGSRDATALVADAAGCRFIAEHGSRGARLKAAADLARGPWLLFVPPGIAPDIAWIEESTRFIEACESRDGANLAAAAFRPPRAAHALRPTFAEIFALLRSALGTRPNASQGLIISKRSYSELGGHRVDSDEPERDLARRLGRRRIVILRCGAVMV